MNFKLLFLVLVIFFSCKSETIIDKSKTLPFYNSEDFTPEWIAKSDKKYLQINKIAPFEFINQDGVKITNKDFEGKIYIANFFFTTCPGICPILAENMGVLQENYKNDATIILLSHTVMPLVDSVEKIKAYATEKKAIANKWHLVTLQTSALGCSHTWRSQPPTTLRLPPPERPESKVKKSICFSLQKRHFSHS